MSEFTGVHKDNPFNSTDFTDCCGVAVIDEKECPECKKTVLRLVKPKKVQTNE